MLSLTAQLATLGALTRSHVTLFTPSKPGHFVAIAQSPTSTDLDEVLYPTGDIPEDRIPLTAKIFADKKLTYGPFGVLVKGQALQQVGLPVQKPEPGVLMLERSLMQDPPQNFYLGQSRALKSVHAWGLQSLLSLGQLFRLPVSPFGVVFLDADQEPLWTSPRAEKLLNRVVGKKTPVSSLLEDEFYESLGIPYELFRETELRKTTLRTPPFLTTILLVRRDDGQSLLVVSDRKEKPGVGPAVEVREKLIQEIHHRVKNNFQMAASLLELQARQHKEEPSVVEALKEAQSRLASMAMVYEFLSQEGTSTIHLPSLLRQLASQLASHTWDRPAHIRVSCDIPFVKADTGTKLSMIVSELVSNSLKHAQPDKTPKLEITALVVGQEVLLSVSDDGPGPPLDFDLSKAKGLGLKIVRSIVEEDFGGVLSLSRQGGLTRFTATFPKQQLVGRPKQASRPNAT